MDSLCSKCMAREEEVPSSPTASTRSLSSQYALLPKIPSPRLLSSSSLSTSSSSSSSSSLSSSPPPDLSSPKSLMGSSSSPPDLSSPKFSSMASSPRADMVAQASPKGSTGREGQSTSRQCLCAPTTHVGSFRCRLHRSSSTTKPWTKLDPSSPTSTPDNPTATGTVQAQ